MTSFTYDILNWNPINTQSFNLLTKINIKPDIKLLELFKAAPLNNILCKISETDDPKYDNTLVFGKIDKSTIDNSYYITLDLVWNSYPNNDKKGKIEFLEKSVYETIDYLENKDASPIVAKEPEVYYKDVETKDVETKNDNNCLTSRMKLVDIILPISISLVIIGLLKYILPEKLFN